MDPTIVIIAYNRPDSFRRVLKSLITACYDGFKNINLIISIDGGGGDGVIEIAEKFEWTYGIKEIIKHEKNIGLRNHVISCGELTRKFENIIIIEDDCFVSRNFYDFSVRSIEFYKDDERISGISLYSYRFNEIAALPFSPLDDGNDIYFMNVPSSLGQIWTKTQWQKFIEYYRSNPVISPNDKLPDNVKSWPESSWKKYFYKYNVEKNLFFVYPRISYLTNFGEKGTHYPHVTQSLQVPIEVRAKNLSYRFVCFDDSCNKYDGFFEILPDCLMQYGIPISEDCIIDLYGSKNFRLYNHLYALSIKKNEQSIFTFGIRLFPFPLNIIFKIGGTAISYNYRKNFNSIDNQKISNLIQNIESIGFGHGSNSILSSKEYKIGNLILHPDIITSTVKRKWIKLFRKTLIKKWFYVFLLL